jgi:predicted amidophosphoribosyltransferase
MAKTIKLTQKKVSRPHCPFCDAELMEQNLPLCRVCQVQIVYCEECGQPIPKGKKTCPTCGKK